MSCATKCKAGGYAYWGLECPRATIHCQCTNANIGNQIGDQKCKIYNVHSGNHCVGPFTSNFNGIEYLHGAGDISSVYSTGKRIRYNSY